MPKVWEQDGFRFYVYFNDHNPSHVHVKKAGGEAIIYLGDKTTKPSIREIRGMDYKDGKKAIEITAKEQTRLVRQWRRIHDESATR